MFKLISLTSVINDENERLKLIIIVFSHHYFTKNGITYGNISHLPALIIFFKNVSGISEDTTTSQKYNWDLLFELILNN